MRTFYVMCMTLVVLQVLDGFTTGMSAKIPKNNNDLVDQNSDWQQQNVDTQKFPVIGKYDFESILKAMSYIFQSIKNEIIKQIAILLKRVTDMVKMANGLVGSTVQQVGKQFKNMQETAGKGFGIISGVGNSRTDGMNNIKDKNAPMIRTPMKTLSNIGGTLPLVGEQFSKFSANTPMTESKLKLNKKVDRQNYNNKVEDVEAFERKPVSNQKSGIAQQKTVYRKTSSPPTPKRKLDPSTEEEETVEKE